MRPGERVPEGETNGFSADLPDRPPQDRPEIIFVVTRFRSITGDEWELSNQRALAGDATIRRLRSRRWQFWRHAVDW